MELSKLEKFLELKAQATAIEKQMKEIKAEIKESFEPGETVVGNVQIQRSLRTRIDLDKEQVLIRLGESGYKECEKISEYEVLTVKRI